MIRTKTTFILGAGASAELHIPGPAEMLDRVAQALDFSRGGANQLTRDSAAIVRHTGALAEVLGCTEEELFHAAQRIQQSARVGRSVEDVIDQNDDEPLVEAFGKLAIAVFTLQAEGRSSLRALPQPNAVLPLQTGDYWLLELGKLITAGLPRSRLEAALDNVAVVSFAYDRAVEHFLPFLFATAYGMPLAEARHIVDTRLRCFHPYGSVGRLPWQAGENPVADWGEEHVTGIVHVAAGLRGFEQALDDRPQLAALRETVAQSQRLVFLGFDFAPQSLDLMIEGTLTHDPELIVGIGGLPPGPNRAAATRILRRKTGTVADDRILLSEGRALDALKDYSLLLESDAAPALVAAAQRA